MKSDDELFAQYDVAEIEASLKVKHESVEDIIERKLKGEDRKAANDDLHFPWTVGGCDED